jgi:hypothetical protein
VGVCCCQGFDIIGSDSQRCIDTILMENAGSAANFTVVGEGEPSSVANLEVTGAVIIIVIITIVIIIIISSSSSSSSSLSHQLHRRRRWPSSVANLEVMGAGLIFGPLMLGSRLEWSWQV